MLEAATRLDAFEQEITSYLSLVSRSFCIQNCVLFCAYVVASTDAV